MEKLNSDASAGKDPFILGPLWEILLQIHAAFAEVCIKCNLTYYVAYGTALGAVRHGGFIPWDDDFDVMMPREDYERMLQVAPDILPKQYRLVNFTNCPDYPNAFAKVVDVRRDVLEAVQRDTGRSLNQGLFIDIFPLDGVEEDANARARSLKELHRLRRIEWHYLPTVSNSPYKIAIKRSLGCIANLMQSEIKSLNSAISAVDRHCKTVPYASSRFAGCVSNRTFWIPKVHPRAVFGQPRSVPFMDTEVPVVADVDSYLKVEYGDYMRLPPEANRRPSHDLQPVASWVGRKNPD